MSPKSDESWNPYNLTSELSSRLRSINGELRNGTWPPEDGSHVFCKPCRKHSILCPCIAGHFGPECGILGLGHSHKIVDINYIYTYPFETPADEMTQAFFDALADNKPELKYISFDPGKSIGIAAWQEGSDMPVIMGLETDVQGLDLLFDYLETKMETFPSHFIIEEYRVFNDKFNHQGSKNFTSQVIGDLKGYARRRSIEVVEQVPDCRRAGAAWAGVAWPKGHMADWLSAYLHGYYYLYNNNIIKNSRVLRERRPLGAKEVD